MFFTKLDEQNSTEIFTYFIPSPPSRTTGYREKDFDTICKVITNQGLNIEILSSTTHQNGMWVISKITGKKTKIQAAFADQKLSDARISDSDHQDSSDEFIIERE